MAHFGPWNLKQHFNGVKCNSVENRKQKFTSQRHELNISEWGRQAGYPHLLNS